LPTQALSTTLVELAAAHSAAGAWKEPQLPVGGDPYRAKSTAAIVAPGMQPRSKYRARTEPGVVIPSTCWPQKKGAARAVVTQASASAVAVRNSTGMARPAAADRRAARELGILLLWYKKPPAGLYAYHRNLNSDFDAALIR
jgi:hypothetical protein